MNLMLMGESGVGKELLAHGIHHLSRRTHGPFVAINVAAFPETMFESELFGYEKGAFTGDTERHLGRFDQANGGSLFLDEVGHLPLPQQAKLLRVLQEKAFHRLGGDKLVRVDVRVVAATDQELITMVREGRFQKSLYFRFQAMLELPPLRDRRADISALVGHFLPIYNRKQERNLMSVSPTAMAYLKQQPWPGNVRQLLSALEVAVVYADPTQGVLEANNFKRSLQAWEGVRFSKLGERTAGELAGEEKRGYLIKFQNSTRRYPMRDDTASGEVVLGQRVEADHRHPVGRSSVWGLIRRRGAHSPAIR